MRFCDILVRITILQFLEVCSIYYIDLFYSILFDKMLYDKPFAFNSVHHMFLCLQNKLQLCYLFLVIYWIILCCVISMFIVLYFCMVIASVIVCALYNFML